MSEFTAVSVVLLLESRAILTKGDTRVSDRVDELAGNNSSDVLGSRAHRVSHGEAHDDDAVGVRSGPDVCELACQL